MLLTLKTGEDSHAVSDFIPFLKIILEFFWHCFSSAFFGLTFYLFLSLEYIHFWIFKLLIIPFLIRLILMFGFFSKPPSWPYFRSDFKNSKRIVTHRPSQVSDQIFWTCLGHSAPFFKAFLAIYPQKTGFCVFWVQMAVNGFRKKFRGGDYLQTSIFELNFPLRGVKS